LVDIEWLKRNFRVANVPGFGRCVVIPIYKFKPEWDEELLQEGYECHAMDDFVYVILGPEDVEASAQHESRVGKGKRWTRDEDQLLIKLWNQNLPVPKIAEYFPGRTEAAVKNRLDRLKKIGKVQSRWSKGAQKEQKIQKVEKIEEARSSAQSDIIEELKEQLSQVVDILNESVKLLGKLNCAVLMQGLQIKQLKGELTIPQNLWIHYANALLEDDKQFQQVFCKKVKQLLEAHK